MQLTRLCSSQRCVVVVPTHTACIRNRQPITSRTGKHTHRDLVIHRAADGDGDGAGDRPSPSGGEGGDAGDGSGAVAIVRKYPGVGYTFVLAGFLKILTMGSLSILTPNGAARTALGQASQYLLIPVSLVLCWVAKQVTDTGLHESRRFMTGLGAVLVLFYFGLNKVLFRYTSQPEYINRPRPTISSPMADMRARMGDTDMSGAMQQDSRKYVARKDGTYDDMAYYVGRYPSQMQDSAQDEGAAGAEGDQPRVQRQRYKRRQGGNPRSFLTTDAD